MPKEKTLQDVVNSVDDAVTAIESVGDSIDKLRPSVIVNVPEQPAPQVTVSPEFNVSVPPLQMPHIVIEARKPVSYIAEVIKRDSYGDIKLIRFYPEEV